MMSHRWLRPMALTLLTAAAVVLLLAAVGCRATQPDDSPAPGTLSIDLDVVPLMVPADTTKRAVVWITVLDGGVPVSDSTLVSLVTNLGQINPVEALTIDGLATSSYQPAAEAGVAMIVAQARGARDTMNITVY